MIKHKIKHNPFFLDYLVCAQENDAEGVSSTILTCAIYLFIFTLDTAPPHPLLPTPSLPLSLALPRCHCASHPAQGLQRYFKRIWEINLTAN